MVYLLEPTSSMSLRIDSPGPGVLRVLLDRFDKRNALDPAIVNALVETLTVPDCRALVLGSADPRVFSSGADLDLDDPDVTGQQELRATPDRRSRRR
jgi:enoyl-CoA hydratase/carnithine racemase